MARTVTYKLEADAQKFTAGIDKATASFSGFTTTLAVGAAAGIAAAVAMGKALGDMALGAAKAGGAIADAMQKSGQSAEMLSGTLSLAAAQSGSSLEAVSAAVAKMQKGIVAGNDAFKQLGLSFQQLKSASPDEAFRQVAESIVSVQNPTEQAAAAIAVFGRSAVELLPTLKAIASGADEMAAAIHASLSGDEVAALDALDDSATTLSLSWERLQEHFIAALNDTGLLSDGLDALSKALGEVSGWIEKNRDLFNGLAVIIRMMVEDVKNLASNIGGFLVTSLHGLGINIESVIGKYKFQLESLGMAMRLVMGPGAGGSKPGSGGRSFSPMTTGDKQAAAERERIWKEESRALADELAERTREYKKHYDEQTDAALKAVEEELRARQKLIDENNRLFMELEKDAAAAAEAEARAQEEAARRSSEAWAKFGSDMAGIANLLGSLGAQGLASIAGLVAGTADMISQAAQRGFVTIGDLANQASAIFQQGSALGGAASGAMTGFAVGGPIGGLIGGAVGGLLGLFGGKKKKKEQNQKLLKDAEAQLKSLADEWDKLRKQFIDEGASGVGALFQNIANGAEASQERMDRLGRMGAAAFELMRAEGMSTLEIMDAMGPTIDAAIAAAEKSGTTLSGPLAMLADFRKKVTDNQALVGAIDGLNQYMSMLRATGSLTQEAFGDVQAEMMTLFNEATAAGFTSNQALSLIAPTLFQIQQAAEAGRITVDAETQALIDQAEAAGLLEGMQDPMQVLVEIQQQMLLVTAALAQAFGATLPASVQEYIDKLNQIPSNITTHVGTTGTGTGGGAGAGGTGDSGSTQGGPAGGKRRQEEGFAAGGLVTRTGPAMLHGSPSRPEMVLNPNQTKEWLRGGDSKQPINVVVNVGPQKIYEMLYEASRTGHLQVHPGSVRKRG